jgi:transposase
MPKPKLLNERARARDLVVHSGFSIQQAADSLNVHRNSVGKWAAEGKWEQQREEVITTPIGIAEELKKEVRYALAEMAAKREQGRTVSDALIIRLERLARALSKLYNDADSPGTSLVALRDFTRYLTRIKAFEALQALEPYLEDYYRSLRDE